MFNDSQRMQYTINLDSDDTSTKSAQRSNCATQQLTYVVDMYVSAQLLEFAIEPACSYLAMHYWVRIRKHMGMRFYGHDVACSCSKRVYRWTGFNCELRFIFSDRNYYNHKVALHVYMHMRKPYTNVQAQSLKTLERNYFTTRLKPVLRYASNKL